MRVRGGKITEHWGVANLFSLLQQLGAVATRIGGSAFLTTPRLERCSALAIQLANAAPQIVANAGQQAGQFCSGLRRASGPFRS